MRKMTVLMYIMAGVMTAVTGVYPLLYPPKSLEEAGVCIKRLQVALFCLFLYCSWFYGRS